MLYIEIATAYIHSRSTPPFLLVQSFPNSELLNEPGFDCGFAFAGGVPCGDRSGVTPALAYLAAKYFSLVHWFLKTQSHPGDRKQFLPQGIDLKHIF